MINTKNEITRNFGRLEAEKNFLEKEIQKLQSDEQISILKSSLSKTGKDLKFEFENIKDSINLSKLNFLIDGNFIYNILLFSAGLTSFYSFKLLYILFIKKPKFFDFIQIFYRKVPI